MEELEEVKQAITNGRIAEAVELIEALDNNGERDVLNELLTENMELIKEDPTVLDTQYSRNLTQTLMEKGADVNAIDKYAKKSPVISNATSIAQIKKWV